MSPKSQKNVNKITHVKLTSKAGDRFNFAAPFDTELQQDVLKAPKIEAGKKPNYVDIPDFLEFRTLKKTQQVSVDSTQPQKEEVKEKITSANKKSSESPSSSIQQEENESIVYSTQETDQTPSVHEQKNFQNEFTDPGFIKQQRKKAYLKASFFAISNILSFVGVVACVWFLQTVLVIPLLIIIWFYIQTFVTLCLLSTHKLIISLVILIESLLFLAVVSVLGLLSVVSIATMIVLILLLSVAAREIERLQLISRILDYPRIVTATRTLLISFLCIVCFSVALHSATYGGVQKKFEQLAPKEYVIKEFQKNSPHSVFVRAISETLSFSEFQAQKKKTVADAVVYYSFHNLPENIIRPPEQAQLGVTATMSEEEKTQVLSPHINSKLQTSLHKDFSSYYELDTSLTSELYARLMINRWYTLLSSDATFSALSFSVPYVPIAFFPFQLGSVVYGILVAALVLLAYIAYIILFGILKLLGLSPEAFWWWTIRKIGILQVSVEKVESEVILL